MNLSIPTQFRFESPGGGVTQQMVRIPHSVLQHAIQGQNIVQTLVIVVTTNHAPVKMTVPASATTVGDLITSLEAQFPGIRERICDETGKVRRFVNIFANDEDIRFLKNLETPVKDSDEISIVPAIAGGQR